MSLLPARVNHTIWKGATFHKTVTLLQGGQGTAPRDLSGFTATLIIRDRQTDEVLLALASGSGITLGGTNGTIEILIPASTTSGLTWKQANYELLITAPVGAGGDTDPIMQGQFNVTGL